MYIIYLLTSSFVGALIYEYSGLKGITPVSVVLSFLLICLINLIISNSKKRYKKKITIFTLLLTILSVADLIKVKFNVSELNLYDFSIIKAAFGVAGQFTGKLPYADITVIACGFAAFLAFTVYCSFITKRMQLEIHENLNESVQQNKQQDIQEHTQEKFQVNAKNPILRKFEKSAEKMDIEKLKKLKKFDERLDFKIFSSWKKSAISFVLLIGFVHISPGIVSSGINSSFSGLVASAKPIVVNAYYSMQSPQQMAKSATKDIPKDENSKPDSDDSLLSGYPFDRQDDMNVVILQSETFFDIVKDKDKLGKNGIGLYEDILENFHKYQNLGISGDLYVPTVGGGTVNTEYEVLTGYSAKYFARGTIVFTSVIKDKTDSIAYYYKDNIKNPETIGIHNHTKEYWDRDRVYPLLGIDTFIDWTKFSDSQRQDLVGAWMSDETIFDKTREMLENAPEKNKFILSVTVQNHGPFLESNEPIMADGLTQDEAWEIENYLGNMKRSDEALDSFMSFIDAYDKPTMVVFYGDHKPAGYDMFDQSDYFTRNDKINMFKTQYFIYFNNAVKNDKLKSLTGKKRDLSAASLDRYIRILLGDDSMTSMYTYNYMKHLENYFDKDIISGAVSNPQREMSLKLINRYVGSENFK